MISELLETIIISKKHFDTAVGFGEQVLDGLAALRTVVLPEVGVQKPVIKC